MNATTGNFHLTNPGESYAQMAARFNALPSDMIPVARLPDKKSGCLKCHGTGSRKAGFFSKRFKPCECVL